MPADWKIEFWPVCTRYAFLSHCQEDRERLVFPVHDELQRLGCRAWIDQHHYPAGRDAFEVLRDKILECRHVVYFVTANYLAQGRGWTGVERSYAMLLQQNLRMGPNELAHVELPLLFVPQNHVGLARSAWGPSTSRGRFYPSGRVDGGARQWAVEQIVKFVRNEEQYAFDVADRLGRDEKLRVEVSEDRNLKDRVLAITPPPLPPID